MGAGIPGIGQADSAKGGSTATRRCQNGSTASPLPLGKKRAGITPAH